MYANALSQEPIRITGAFGERGKLDAALQWWFWIFGLFGLKLFTKNKLKYIIVQYTET